MGNLTVPENPEYTEEIRKFETTDPAHADLLNQVAQALLSNEAFLRRLAEQHIGNQDNPHSITKSQIGLGNADDTSDLDKPISAAQKAALDEKIGKSGGTMDGKLNIHGGMSLNESTTAAENLQFLLGIADFAEGGTVHWQSAGNVKVGEADKAAKDSDGRVIKDAYAKKSIYGDAAVSMGRKTGTAAATFSFAIGNAVEASSNYAHAEGNYTVASGVAAHAEGSYAMASGSYAHAEGLSTEASSNYAHAEGNHTVASGVVAHAEGNEVTASSNYAHAEGNYTVASGVAAHAEGQNTEASNYSSHASGKHNKAMINGGASNTQIGDAFVIGNGNGSTSKSNALRVTYMGDILGTKAFQSSGADYAEFIKPWADGNPESEDRVGYFVTIKDGLLYKAQAGDYIAGITSGNPSVLGNADEDYYWRYERDEFNRIVMEDVPELVQQEDENGNLIFTEETHEPIMAETGNIIKNARMKLAEGYDPALQESYIPRAERPEWSYVGMLGVLPVRDDGTCIPGRFCRCGAGGIATLAGERGFDTFFVIERKADNIVSVIMR